MWVVLSQDLDDVTQLWNTIKVVYLDVLRTEYALPRRGSLPPNTVWSIYTVGTYFLAL